MAYNIWRPVDFENDAHSKRVQEGICQLIVANIHGDMIYKCVSLTLILDIEPPKKKTRRCKVSEAEEKIVLQSYEMFSTAGWKAALENVKELVREPMSGNAFKVNKIKDYYQPTSSNAALKRIQRIVSQNVQRTLQPHHQATASTSTSQTQQMSEAIKQTKTRYSKKV